MYKQPNVLQKLSDRCIICLDDVKQVLRELTGKQLKDQVNGIADAVKQVVC